jgi:O-antigen ligase
MSASGGNTAPLPAAGHHGRAGLTLEQVQLFSLWVMIASGWLVVIEPAPYEFLFLFTLILYLPTGLLVTVHAAPLIIFLALYNIGGFMSAMQVEAETKRAVTFVLVSAYMAVMAMFFALAVARDPLKIVRVIRSAWIVAAVIAATTGLIGYFDIAGMGARWAPIARAQGTFKDPNVLSTFLVAPAIFLIQDFMLRRVRHRILGLLSLLIILAALFLAFSRGAWAVFVGSVFLLGLITFVTTPSPALRSRILLISLFGAIVAFALIAVLLNIPSVRAMLAERLTLLQPYDAGETGRFARQLRSIPFLLERPLGLGPHQFGLMFGEDPHNVYLNAFSSYGWLGGISYLLLIVATVYAGLRAIFTETPWRHHAIAFFAPLFMIILQGFQIDTDHWRHFYLLLGVTWGLFAASDLCRLGAHPFVRCAPAEGRGS